MTDGAFHPSAELCPWLHIRSIEFARAPETRDLLEELLQDAAGFGRIAIGAEVLVELTDRFVAPGEERRHHAHHGEGVELVEIGEDLGLRKWYARGGVDLGNDLQGLGVTPCGATVDVCKREAVPYPELGQLVRLPLTEGRQLVIVF